MSGASAQSRLLLLGILVLTGVLGFFGKVNVALAGWTFLCCAAGHLVAAVVLATGRNVPGWLGRSAVGQALSSMGALSMGVLLLAERFLPAGVAWAVATMGVIAFCSGLVLERRARQFAEAPQS
jgi:hypothetical protein